MAAAPKIIDQYFDHRGFRYSVAVLAAAAEGLPVFKLAVRGLFLDYGFLSENTLTDFIRHWRRVESADLGYPIILSPEGVVLDGRHRLAKALINGDKTVNAVQLLEMPLCCEPVPNQ